MTRASTSLGLFAAAAWLTLVAAPQPLAQDFRSPFGDSSDRGFRLVARRLEARVRRLAFEALLVQWPRIGSN